MTKDASIKERLREQLVSEWKQRYRSDPNGLADEVFCVMSVEHAGANSAEASHIRFHPTEICLVPFKLRSGPLEVFHTFLKPKIPTGFAAVARKHSDLRHGIPLQDPMLSEDYEGVAAKIQNLLKLAHPNRLYCPRTSTEPLQCALDFLRDESNVAFKTEVCCLEDLLAELHLWQVPQKRVTLTTEEVRRMLALNIYDYTSGVQCQFHYDIDNFFCARATALRNCYVILHTLGFKNNVHSGRMNMLGTQAKRSVMEDKKQLEEGGKDSADDDKPFRFIRPKNKSSPTQAVAAPAMMDLAPPNDSSTPKQSPTKSLGMMKRGILRDSEEVHRMRWEAVEDWIHKLDPNSASPSDSDSSGVGGVGSHHFRCLSRIPAGLQLGPVPGDMQVDWSAQRPTTLGLGRGFKRAAASDHH